ncbi:hypothetical protein PVAP13_2NG097884 [Panicum virgatum]|uniref:Uncharacterized protein n=1 Tax=Panicum virgatum TaxID=38727 RepID=A0A8T0VL67_PANVG|nr:hypothetical protein PVAP13_2NG097884 [Panicum virgatum]
MLMGLQWLRSLPSSSPSDDGIHTSSSRLIHLEHKQQHYRSSSISLRLHHSEGALTLT